jgi:superfamily II DNA or RNA helicase
MKGPQHDFPHPHHAELPRHDPPRGDNSPPVLPPGAGGAFRGVCKMSLQQYRQFIASRAPSAPSAGFAPHPINTYAKAHQDTVLRFALDRGKSAAFLDTGLGKSLVELEFARQCAEETGKPSLILTPLAVAGQMIREGHKFGIDARQIREQSEVGAGVMVANYERLPKLDPTTFGAVVLDESSILKSYAGRTRALIQDAFFHTPYKMAATATPSPNDHTELGNHAEFLGVMRQQEMLSKWFINDTATASQDWRLKGHAITDFWNWVASWSRCATLPSDLGGDDTGYILPEVERRIHEVAADRMADVGEGMLFRIPEMSATSFHAEKRLTLRQRCELAAELATHDKPVTVWCETNDESTELTKIIPGAVEVRGDLDPDEKERRLLGFSDGDYRVIVTKPKLAGFGVNWQHCAHAVFASISFSYEQHYQAVRRSHRFGQSETVRNDIVISDTEASIWNVINVKSKKHDEMKRRMADAMRAAQSTASRRVKYERPLDLAFPAWLKTEGQK